MPAVWRWANGWGLRQANVGAVTPQPARTMTNQTTLPMPETFPADLPGSGARRPTALRLGVAAATVLGALALGWQGGALGLAGALAAAVLLPAVLRHGRAIAIADATVATMAPDGANAADAEPRVSGGRVGAEVMVGQVVPVWGKQLDVTRAVATDGLGDLLNTFSQMADSLNMLVSQLDRNNPTLEAGAINGALADNSPGHAALAALLVPSQRAFAQRDAAVAELTRCAQAIAELRQLGRQAREIGKHTRLVAFNASIEANRGSQASGSGSMAVANETRMLAARMAEVGEQIERLVARLDRTLGPERLRGEISDTPDDELRLELDVRAREALNALLGSLGAAMQNSGEVKATAEALRDQIENTFVQFQFGDRISQMLDIVGVDMQNFTRWVTANPYATQSDAAEWLAKLGAKYTMNEQRAQHHGNVHIDRGSEIEFF